MASLAEQRLSAILSADVVGYSRLVEADEARTLADLKFRPRSMNETVPARSVGDETAARDANI